MCRNWSAPRKPRSRRILGIGDRMRAALRSRLERLEVKVEPKKPHFFRSGYLKTLPTEYVGERHVVIVKREPSGNGEWCEFGRGRRRWAQRRSRTVPRYVSCIGRLEFPRAKATEPLLWQTTMMIKSLSRRLDRLETSIMPTSTTRDPLVIELQFVSVEKVVTGSMSIEVDLPAPQSPKRWRGR